MDSVIYWFGDGVCSSLNTLGGNILASKIGCGLHNYDIGLMALISAFFLLTGGFGIVFWSGGSD
jgi:hypothetical protein